MQILGARFALWCGDVFAAGECGIIMDKHGLTTDNRSHLWIVNISHCCSKQQCAEIAFWLALIMPFSVIIPDRYLAGVTSNAGFRA
jgi:hypothetical protein